ncbi:MAG: WHG domain-containing protein [Alphaproteobacteria bacterium]|nr:WHG domain-containing protein [Alphaproteobacteria bacterium]MCB9796670.1 WHG domain-containing protein [Alphaproteobacteria bacterium]
MDSRARLLTALDEALREGEVAALSVRSICRQAGVSHNLPTVLFGDKRGLYTAYAARAFRELGRRLTEASAEVKPGPAALAATGRAYVRFALEHPRRFELMFRQDQLDAEDLDYKASCAEGFAPLAASIRGLSRGADRQQGRDVGTAAWAMVHGLAVLQLGGHLGARARGDDLDAALTRITELFAERMGG